MTHNNRRMNIAALLAIWVLPFGLSASSVTADLVVPVDVLASSQLGGGGEANWSMRHPIINAPNEFNVATGVSGDLNDIARGLIGYVGNAGTPNDNTPVPANSAGIPFSPLLWDFAPDGQYGPNDNVWKPQSLGLTAVGQTQDQWVEIELPGFIELEQIWMWSFNDGPETGRAIANMVLQTADGDPGAGQLGAPKTWIDHTTYTGVRGQIEDRPVDFTFSFPAGTSTRYIRLWDLDNFAAGPDPNVVGVGPVFIFDTTAVSELTGDLNGDGFVGQDDLNIILGAWGQNIDPPGNPMTGDPSNDGFVGQDDLNFVLGQWGQGTPGGLSAVPEPAAGGLCLTGGLLAALGLLLRHSPRLDRHSQRWAWIHR